MIGRSINNYKILEELSRNETVGVYKAVDLLLSRNVVVKVLETESSPRPEIAESFRYEAATLAKFDHSSIPTLHSLTAVDEELFMISEFAEGETLDRILLREGKMSVEKAASIFSQVFDCVEYTHKNGAAHGWLKTSHILLTDAGHVKVLGFGTSENYPSAETIADEKGFETGEYICSKRASENKADRENDIYALAAMLYETLTGKSLFDAEKVVGSRIPKAVESVISEALSPNSAETFQSVSEFRSALVTAGFRVSDDKITVSPIEKSVGEKSGNKNVSVFTVDFAETENDVLKEESNQNPVQTAELNNEPPYSVSGKSGRKRYKIAGAAIFAILVLHSVWQFSFIQSENLRAAEAELKTIQLEKLPVPVKKDKPPVEVKPVYEAKKSDVVISPKAVQPATYRQSEIKPAPPTPKKKAVSESKSERLRRAEKLLTGM
jgi:eukaryotic-like serine/threonine-protein kinase